MNTQKEDNPRLLALGFFYCLQDAFAGFSLLNGFSRPGGIFILGG